MKSSTSTAATLVALLPALALAAPSSAPPSNVRAGLVRRSNAKKGLAFNDVPDTSAFVGDAAWSYNWGSAKPSGIDGSIEFVPMLWCNDASHTGSWNSDASAAIAGGATAILAFNEPDLSGQCDISVADAVTAWNTYIQPFAGQVTLVSPAVTNGASPLGQTWLDEFISACTGCTIDAIALHIYDSASNTAYYQNYLSDAASKYGKPIWVTEFGINDGDPVAFLNTMLPWLDGESGIGRYAYFMDGDSSFGLTDSSGNPTAAGSTYQSVN